MRLVTEQDYAKLNDQKGVNSFLPPLPSQRVFKDLQDSGESYLNMSSIPDDIKLKLFSKAFNAAIDKLESIRTNGSSIIKEEKLPQIAAEKVSSNVKNRSFESKSDKVHSKSKPNKLAQLSADDLELLSDLPPVGKANAMFLLQTMKNAEELISWNKQGVVSFEGHRDNKTNIKDILNYCLRTQSMDVPRGASRFLKVAQSLNVPNNFFSARVKPLILRPVSPIKEKSVPFTPDGFPKTFSFEALYNEDKIPPPQPPPLTSSMP